jgi:hypothetical protein
MSIICITTRNGARFYLGANGPTKQRARALNCFSKTVERKVEAFKASEWYIQNGKGSKITTEDSLPGSLGRPRKEHQRRQAKAEKRGRGRPKGSKNKPKAEPVAAPEAEAAVAAG